MAEVIRMPKMSDTMTEGVIAAWHKKVGDNVKSGDLLAEVETDKATMELESYETGTLLYIGVNAKEAAPIDGVIAIIGKSGEKIDDLLKGLSSGGTIKEESKPTVVESSAPAIDTSSINAEVIRMPKMSDTMVEGTIVAWKKKVGDKVKSGDLLAEVATDKATMELESYSDGTLLYIGVKDGESIVVDGILAIIGEAGVDYKPLLAAPQKAVAKTEVKQEETINPSKTTSSTSSTSSNTSSDSRIKASPLAKKIAKDKGIDIKQVQGSGEFGRIVKKDIESFNPSSNNQKSESKSSSPSITLPQVVGQESFEEVPVSQMRKAIAKRVAESLSNAPHFYIVMEINMDKAIEARTSINEVASVKISFNDMVIKATAAALRKHPLVNSSWLGDKIRYNHHINIGVAMAVGEALLIPVVRFADNKSLSHIGAEVKDFSAKAKNKQLTPADWTGSTFTISNLGMFGVDEFTAIINPPDACILAVGGIKQTPVIKNGQVVPGNIMKVTLSCDHRVVDGAAGAAFLQTLKSLLEDPIRILA